MKISYKDENNDMKEVSRRDTLKIMGIGGASLMLSSSETSSAAVNLPAPSSKKKAKIVIVGGGTGGIMAAARLRRSAQKAEITLISPNSTHLYQSGQVYVAAGLYSEFDNKRPTKSLLPDGAKWLQEKVISFDPDNNKVKAEKSGDIKYDYLIIAMGCEYDYSAIEGLKISDIGKNGIASVYLNNVSNGEARGGIITRQWFKSIQRHASRGSVKVLLADPDTPVKGEGASLDMLFLCNDYVGGNGPKKFKDFRKNVQFTLTKPGSTLIGNQAIDKALKKIIKNEKNINALYGYTLKKIDQEKKTALFTKDGKEIEQNYNYIHITPPMNPPEVFSQSKIAFSEGKHKGWMEVDEKTLRHPKYKNVFGIGDILGLDTSKSGGAAREQAIIIQDNVAADMEGHALPISYSGYTVVPVRTNYGKLILAEYDRKGLAPTFPFDPTKPRWIWWEMDLHLIRAAYFQLMMRGMM